MKTDLIEIFQTIRASLQPYATLGFDNRTNSDTVYDLWSNKNVEIAGADKNEVFFTSVSIEEHHITIRFFSNDQIDYFKDLAEHGLRKLLNKEGYIEIVELDDASLSKIEEAIAAAFKIFKDKDWVA
ncbi:hypothetical protein [Pedobacter sp. JCM 36344]|uniref:hypothetical protein n=1 Tax=Pedobacter sp. JCM 36344 TaxID=3374280 RepID=UPI00397CFB16